MVFKNATIVTMNDNLDILKGYDLHVKDNVIMKIEQGIDIPGEETIDCSNNLIIPGMINTHCHIPMSIFRSLGEEGNDRLKKYVFPIEGEFITKENVRTATSYSLLETIASGMTTIADMYYYESDIAEVFKEYGVRAVLGETMIDEGGDTFNDVLGKFPELDDLITKYKDDEIITPCIAPHAPYTNSEENLIKCMEYAKEHNLLKMIHLSEMKFEDGPYKGFGSPIKYLDSLGFLDEKTIVIHVLYVDDEDLDILQKRKCKVAHNPVSNAKGGRKIMDIKKFFDRGITVGLGTDGHMSGNLLDLQSVMYFTNKIHKYNMGDRSFLKSLEVFKMVTIDAAKVLNLDEEIGSIEVGKKADLVVVDYMKPNMYPVYDIYSGLVNSFNKDNVKLVMINGKTIFKNNTYLTADYEEVFKNFTKLIEEINDYLATKGDR